MTQPYSQAPPAHLSRLAHLLPRASVIVTIALPAVVLLIGGYDRRWMSDDGFINVRVAHQLLAGNGFVFNAGERTEAITSPLWVMLLCGAGHLGLRLDDAAWSLGLALAVVGIAASGYAGSRRLAERYSGSALFLPFGLLCYACLPPAWDYATSGLENGLGVAFIGVGHWLVARTKRSDAAPRSSYLAALVLSAAPIVRPDYVLLGYPLVVYLCVRARGMRARLGILTAGVSSGAVYQIFRMGYFASPVPNTALAKEAFRPYWEQGFHYFWNSAGLYVLWLPFAALVALLVARACLDRGAGWRGSLSLVLFGSGIVHLLYVMRVGGDFMHGRLLLPGLFTLFSALPSVSIDRARGVRHRVALGVPLLAGYIWCILCAAALRVAPKNEFSIGDERGWYAQMSKMSNPTRLEHYARFAFHSSAAKLGKRLARKCPKVGSAKSKLGKNCKRVLITRRQDGVLKEAPRSGILPLDESWVTPEVAAVVAFRPLGIAGNVLGLHVNVVDYFGLADPVASRLALGKRRRPGHEKAFGTRWLIAKYAARHAVVDERTLSARRALDCGELAELGRATRDPLDVARFLKNLRFALTSHRLRVPSDPNAAQALFCDDSSGAAR